MNPDPETAAALEYLEDWGRLGLTGPRPVAVPGQTPAGSAPPGQPHVCDDQCRPAPANPINALTAGVAIAAAAQHESETVARTIREAPNGVAYLDELLRVAITPARRRRWWWPR
jgi:hypothetical protein